MCRRTENTAVRNSDGGAKWGNNIQKDASTWWPVSAVAPPSLIFIIAAVLLLLPVHVLLPRILKSMLFNAGYTKWFHWLSLVYLLTPQNSKKFLSKFLAIMGMTVTLGWWASMLYDLVVHGRFAHILHLNMPFTHRMVVILDDANNNNNGQLRQQTVVYNEHTLPFIFLSHALDTLGHPVLALYFWKINNWDIGRICTWPVLVSAYMLSRTWSLVRLSIYIFRLDLMSFFE